MRSAISFCNMTTMRLNARGVSSKRNRIWDAI